MKTATEIIELLRDRIALLELLGKREIPGFAVVVPPEGDPILALNLGSNVDLEAFYKDLAANLSQAMKSASPAVGMGSGPYRAPGR